MTQAPLPFSMENVSIDHDHARLIDHTLLRPEATITDIERLCDEAKRPGIASACTNPSHVALRARFLKEHDVKVCTVIGFPLGATSTAAKAYETEAAIRN